MAIDYEAIDSANITFPTKKIPVPMLKAFFPEGEEPVWEIKSLTGMELAMVEESAERVKVLKGAMEAFAKGTVKGFKDGYDELLNQNAEATPESYMRWISLVRYGSVPPCPEHIAVKLAHSSGGMLRRLAHEIAIMSAMGANLGE